MPVILNRKRDVNWCSLYGEPEDCFPHDEACFRFDSHKVNLPALLTMSGLYASYLDAVRAGHKGFVEFGWSFHENQNITCYIWNPDPDWQDPADHPSDDDDEAMIGERDFLEEIPPWFEKPEAWDDDIPFGGSFGP